MDANENKVIDRDQTINARFTPDIFKRDFIIDRADRDFFKAIFSLPYLHRKLGGDPFKHIFAAIICDVTCDEDEHNSFTVAFPVFKTKAGGFISTLGDMLHLIVPFLRDYAEKKKVLNSADKKQELQRMVSTAIRGVKEGGFQALLGMVPQIMSNPQNVEIKLRVDDIICDDDRLLEALDSETLSEYRAVISIADKSVLMSPTIMAELGPMLMKKQKNRATSRGDASRDDGEPLNPLADWLT